MSDLQERYGWRMGNRIEALLEAADDEVGNKILEVLLDNSVAEAQTEARRIRSEQIMVLVSEMNTFMGRLDAAGLKSLKHYVEKWVREIKDLEW